MKSVAAAVASLVVVAAAADGSEAARRPTRLQVTATEFQLVFSRGTVGSGPVIVELVNRGEDDHDLALRRIGPGAVTRRIRPQRPGDVAELTVTLRPGRYRVWCGVGDHHRRGMHAVLVVRR